VEDYLVIVLCNNPPPPAIGTITQPTCLLSTGSVALNTLPSGNWTLIRNPGGISTTGSGNSFTVTGLSQGTYTFTVINSDECTSDPSANVVINPPPPSPQTPVIGTVTQPACGIASGSVVLNGLPSAGTWTLTRTPGNVTTTGTGTSSTITGLLPGTYNYIVTNSSGCTSPATAAIVINDPPPVPPAPVQSVDCTLGYGNGLVTVTGPVGTGLEYRLNDGAYQSSPQFTGVDNGNYTITVRNAQGCTSTGAQFTVFCVCVNEPSLTLSSASGLICGVAPFTVSGNVFGGSATGVTISENGNGSISPSNSNTSPFSFTYTPATGDAGNTVTITVTTNNPLGFPCEAATATFSLSVVALPQAPVIGTVTQPSCTVATGSVVLSGLPSAGTWTITRTPGNVTTTGTGTSTTITGLLPGTYNYSVTNSSGCTSPSTAAIVINDPPPVPPAPSQSVDCTLGNGNGLVTVTSPVGTGLEYRLNDGTYQSSTQFTGVANGAYTITVRNAQGCTSTGPQFTVALPQVPVVGTLTQPSCLVMTGSVVLNGLPSTGTWTLTRTPGNVTTTGTGTSTAITGLTAGTYNFIVANSAGCISPQSANVVINQPPPPIPAPVIGTITHPTCTSSNGSVALSGLPVTGTWSLLPNPGGVIITGTGTTRTIVLPEGTYTFTVTDAAGCISLPSAEAIVNDQPDTPAAPSSGSIIQPTCSVSTGTVVLNGLPATGTWTLSRYPGTITTTGNGVTTTISGLTTGAYNFSVTNSAGCTSALSSNIIIAAQPVTPGAPVAGNITQPTCAIPTGSVNLTGLPATGTWTLTRTPGNLNITGTGTSTIAAGLMVGTYSFTVTNSFGCQSLPSANVVILANPSNPTIVINQPDAVCSPSTVDLTSPSITAGSTTGLTYSYWTNAEGTIQYNTPATASAGTYYIMGITQSLCSDIKPVTVDVRNNPAAYAGPDQVLEYQFTTSLNADDPETGETGMWSVFRGSGHFDNPNDASSNVSGLSLGENIFLWVVANDVCTPALDSLIITVNDLSIPTLITPNNDGKNDFLIIKGIESQEEATLTIFDRRGVRVFEDHNYDNTWDGIDENGDPLPDDTYFYIVETAGRSRTGFIVIRK
jgi:gliding motility-associated-like protein